MLGIKREPRSRAQHGRTDRQRFAFHHRPEREDAPGSVLEGCGCTLGKGAGDTHWSPLRALGGETLAP